MAPLDRALGDRFAQDTTATLRQSDVFLNDINELNEIVSSLVQCCSDKPDVWKERVAEINGRSGDLSLLDHAFMNFMHDSRHQ
jgi:hypothetical protein